MTKEEFFDWKRHPVTQQVMSQLRYRIDTLKDELVGTAISGDSTVSAHKAGAIQAYQDMTLIEYEGD